MDCRWPDRHLKLTRMGSRRTAELSALQKFRSLD